MTDDWLCWKAKRTEKGKKKAPRRKEDSITAQSKVFGLTACLLILFPDIEPDVPVEQFPEMLRRERFYDTGFSRPLHHLAACPVFPECDQRSHLLPRFRGTSGYRALVQR